MNTTINTTIGSINLTVSSWRDEIRFEIDDAQVKLVVPSLEGHADVLAAGCKVEYRLGGYSGGTVEESRLQIKLAALVTDWAEMINEGNGDAIAEAKAKLEAERAAAAKAREEREAELQRRRDILLNELVSERVNIRQYSYKTMRQAVVDVREMQTYDREQREYVTTGYRPQFNYVNRADASRTQDISEIKRLDVKIAGTRKWKTVWDDGMDDLSEWDRDSPSLKPVQDRYDGSLERDA